MSVFHNRRCIPLGFPVSHRIHGDIDSVTITGANICAWSLLLDYTMSHFHKTVNFVVTAPRTSHLKRIHIKRKAIPLQVWIGPEGSRKLRFPDFMTTAQDRGKVVSLRHRPP